MFSDNLIRRAKLFGHFEGILSKQIIGPIFEFDWRQICLSLFYSSKKMEYLSLKIS